MTTPQLVAVAHGSSDPAATRAVHSLVDEVRRARPGLDAVACFLDHASPRLDDVLAHGSQPAVVVPLLLTAAFHSGVDIPVKLAAAGRPVTQAPVLGPHPLLLVALERRLTEAGVEAGDDHTAVVLAAAGSTDPLATRTVVELAASWESRGWWAVTAAFASAAEPTVEAAVSALRRRGAPRVAVASYLLAPGLFADRLADTVADTGADAVSAPLGAAPEVASVVLERYDAALRGPG